MNAEPRWASDLSESPARTFHVANETEIIATIEIDYRGGGWWAVHVDNGGPRPEPELFRGWIGSSALRRAQQYAAIITGEIADQARADCAKICGTDGTDTDRRPGDFACGVMSPHGISYTVSDVDGNDMTQDYDLNGV